MREAGGWGGGGKRVVYCPRESQCVVPTFRLLSHERVWSPYNYVLDTLSMISPEYETKPSLLRFAY